jgi:lipid-A-disaccharide synthase
MKYYIIAGEASGDLHGSNLMKALREEDPGARFRIWGGDRMEAAGGEVVRHYRNLAFMGFWEVLLNLRTIFRHIKFCKRDIEAYQPDVLILIDYPGFNLRIARWARSKGIKVFYYISPQLWAWHSSRVHGIKASVDRMFVILPFEADFYESYGYQVNFVGHPLLDEIEGRPEALGFRREYGMTGQPLIALLPGSRRQEISRMLEVMLQVTVAFPQFQFAIAAAPSVDEDFYRQVIRKTETQKEISLNHQRLHLIPNRTYDLLQHADAALVTSGTATLETGLLGVPQVVCYRGSKLSYLIARRLVNVKYISLVNLIVDRPLVPELIQDDFNAGNLQWELAQLFQAEKRQRIRHGYGELREKLGHAGASRRTARLIVMYLSREENVVN